MTGSRRAGGRDPSAGSSPRAARARLAAVLTGCGLAASGVGACGADGPGPAALRVERDTVGDTVVVRTLAGQAWESDAVLEPELRIGTFEGEEAYMLGDVNGLAVGPEGAIYLYDRQGPSLRKYSADGRYLATFAREGSGPGEYKQSDGGLAVLPDGRVLLRDPGNARINVYSSDGESLDHWDLRGGYFTSNPLVVDSAGYSYTQVWGTDADGERYSGLRRISPRGESLDSILAPDWDHEPATISVQRERMSMMNSVPFSPRESWAFSPHGYYMGGVSTDYSIDLFRHDGSVLRIQRAVEPVPVDPDEAENERARATANFQRAAPDWKWNGPAIPSTKPAFTSIHAGTDGRIWVRVPQPGVRVPDEELHVSSDPGAPPPDRWDEPIVYDVFETDGTYLGRVRAPDGFRQYPSPVYGPDHVWAITTDDLDVQYLTRFRIQRRTTDS